MSTLYFTVTFGGDATCPWVAIRCRQFKLTTSIEPVAVSPRLGDVVAACENIQPDSTADKDRIIIQRTTLICES